MPGSCFFIRKGWGWDKWSYGLPMLIVHHFLYKDLEVRVIFFPWCNSAASLGKIWEISTQPYVEVSPQSKSFVGDSMKCIQITGGTHTKWRGGTSDRILELKFLHQWFWQWISQLLPVVLGPSLCVIDLTLWCALPFFPSCHFPSFSFLSYPAPLPPSFCLSCFQSVTISHHLKWSWKIVKQIRIRGWGRVRQRQNTIKRVIAMH